jgi:hypothetical protein
VLGQTEELKTFLPCSGEKRFMDLNTLLSVRAFKFDNLEVLYKLEFRFTRYVEVLKNFANDAASDDELNRAQEELLRLLRHEEHRFYEWNGAERVLNQDVFGLAELPVEYLECGVLDEAASRASVTFQRLTEQAKDELKEIEEEISHVKQEQRLPLTGSAGL